MRGRPLWVICVLTVTLSAVVFATASSPGIAANKPTVGCFSYQTQRVEKKVKPRQCTLVVKHQCGGACSADQVYLDQCVWLRWKQHRARGRCTHRANMGFHKRQTVKLRRVRGDHFTRAKIGGHWAHIHYHVHRP
jgi:hypothetical protein